MGMSTAPGPFPREFEGGFFKSLDRNFVLIFLGCFLVFFTLFFIGTLTVEPQKEMTVDQIAAIQERYAKLVLNKEIPKKEKKAEAAERVTAQEEVKKEEVEKKEESVAEKVERKEATKVDRAKKRESMKKQIENVGLFAELTAAGGFGSGGSRAAVKDLISDADGAASLSDLSLSSKSFVQKKETQLGLRERRGEKAAGGTIEESQLAAAKGGEFASGGSVAVSSSAVENIQGDGAADANRDGKALQVVLRKYTPRLQQVYERYLKRNPDLAGKIIFKFTIESDGSVTGISIISSELNNPTLEDELLKRISRIRFQPASGRITIEWPIVFSSQN